MKSIAELYRDLPDASGHPVPPPRPRPPGGASILRVFLVLFALSASGIVWIWIEQGYPLSKARESAARTLLAQLATAVEMYRVDHGECPPGDGSGSKELAAALSRCGPKSLPYFTFDEGMLDGRGHIRNPVREGTIVRYLNPWEWFADEGAEISLWCEDAEGDPRGILVSSPGGGE